MDRHPIQTAGKLPPVVRCRNRLRSEAHGEFCGQHSGRRARSRGPPANSLANYRYPYPLSLLDSSERSFSGACDLGSSFLSCVRLSHAAEPARDCVAATVTRRLLPFSPNLASLVPGFSDPLKYVVMAGAVTGGGLTVIANSPNPAGQSILASRFWEAGISPLYLCLGALVPTLIAGAAFMLLP